MKPNEQLDKMSSLEQYSSAVLRCELIYTMEVPAGLSRRNTNAVNADDRSSVYIAATRMFVMTPAVITYQGFARGIFYRVIGVCISQSFFRLPIADASLPLYAVSFPKRLLTDQEPARILQSHPLPHTMDQGPRRICP